MSLRALARLEQWRDEGIITPEQFGRIAALVRRDRFSVFIELSAFLFLGVVSIIAGVGWVIQEYLSELGDAAIIGALTLLFAGCLYYCFSRAFPYSNDAVESPNLAFDYILYLGCLALGVELGYVETRFGILGGFWNLYLLFSSGLFFFFAYRFDNRFVLSLALSTLGAWFGISMDRFGSLSAESLRIPALIYGVLVALAGAGLHRRGMKQHFTETYNHIAANVVFIALLSGVLEAGSGRGLYLAALSGVSALAILRGIRLRKFAFVLYGVGYFYIGLSAELIRNWIVSPTVSLAYLVISGAIVVTAMVILARRIARES